MSKISLFYRPLAFAIFFATFGCTDATLAKKSTINDVTKKFSDVMNNSANVINIEIHNKIAVRRDEALMFYLKNPSDELNITKAGVQRSFANFVCAGSGAMKKQAAFLKYGKEYASVLIGITTPAGDSFSEQWQKFYEEDTSAELKIKTDEVSNNCITALIGNDKEPGMLAFNGKRATDTSDEVVISEVIDAAKVFYEVLKTAATDALKLANEVESRKQFTKIVEEQHEIFSQAITSHLPEEKLRDAWNRRKARSLWRPFYTFNRMILDLNPQTDQYEFVALSSELQNQLSEFDAIRVTLPPDRVVSAIKQSEALLLSVARNENVDLGSIIEFLTILSDHIIQIKNDYDNIKDKSTVIINLLDKSVAK